MHSSERRKKTLRFFLPFIIVLLGIFCFFLLYKGIQQFTIQHIELVGSGMKLEINERLFFGNTLFFPSEKVREQLLSSYPQFSDVVIEKKIPNTILIIPTLRTPFAELVTPTASFLLDEEGVVIRPSYDAAELSDLPVISGDIPFIRLGGIIKDDRVVAAIYFLRLTKKNMHVKSITVQDEQSLLAKTDESDIFFSHDDNIQAIVSSLQFLLSGFRIKGTIPKHIDLRFTKPVIQW